MKPIAADDDFDLTCKISKSATEAKYNPKSFFA
jgi:hypothetical protein